jgi:small acid-soluble spore protein D (minor alpha/beta-type SASP)
MSSNDSLVPNAKSGLNNLKGEVMRNKGYQVDPNHPEAVKYEVAKEVGVPLKKGYNGDLTAKQAGKIGGNIGGPMVREMIKMAQKNLQNAPETK